LLTNTVAEGTVIGHHHPFRSSARGWKEAENEIVGAGGSRVANGELSEMFGIGRSDGCRPIKDHNQTYSSVAYSIESPAPHTVPVLLVTRQTVEEIIAVDDDRHSD